MYVAAHDRTSQGNIPLVANYSGTHFYHSSSFWGRTWTIFYGLCNDGLEKEKFDQTMPHICKIFKNHLPAIRNTAMKYLECLKKKARGEQIAEDYHQYRRDITAWNDATGPFLRLVKEQDHKLTQPFKKLCDFEVDPQKLQKIINQEGYFGGPLPFRDLKRLATEEKLEDDANNALKAWMEQIKKEKEFSIDQLHEALRVFVGSIGLRQTCLFPLEYALLNIDGEIFGRKDPAHVSWRDSLKPGRRLICNGKEIILAEQLGKKENGEDNSVIFAIENDSLQVVIVGRNKACLGITREIQKQEGFGIPSAKIGPIDPENGFAIVERLYSPLKNFPWEPCKGGITTEQWQMIRVIGELVKWMIDHSTPDHLSIDHLMLNSKGRITSAKVKVFEEKNLNFTALEDFVFSVARGNLTIFSTLMEQSQLRQYPGSSSFFGGDSFYSRLFEELLDLALTDREEDPIARANSYRISDPGVIDRAQSFHQKVQKLKTACLEELKKKICKGREFENAINSAIKEFYKQSKAVTILWPKMEEMVIKHILM